MLSKNPNILVSMLNTKLRDYYSSLEMLCEDLDQNKEEVMAFLKNAGYVFDKQTNQFKIEE